MIFIGVITELKELVEKVNYNKDTDLLYCTSDFMDRGPDPVGCFRYLRSNNCKFVVANHENKMTRWLYHHDREVSKNIENPMKHIDDKTKKEYLSLTEEEVNYISKFSLYLKLGTYKGNDILLCHGGFEPAKPLDKQDPKKVMRLRYVDSNGRMISVDNPLQKPPGASLWNEVWQGPESVIFGHNILSMDEPVIDYRSNYFTASIDTGCVFDGNLTALILEDNTEKPTFVQVKAKQKYWSF